MATIGQGFAIQRLIEDQRRAGRGDTFVPADAAAFGGAGYDGFNYAGGSPSMNIPTAPSAQSTMAGIGQRALENTSVAEAIARGRNQDVLGLTETLEDAERQAIHREMAREQQNLDRFSGGVISGNTSAGDREWEAARRGLMRDFHTRQLENTKLEAQMQQRAMLHALGIEAKGATLDIQAKHQRDLQALLFEDKQADRDFRRAENELTRRHQESMADAQGKRQMQIAEMNNKIARDQLNQNYTMHKQRIKHDIAKTKFAAQQNMMPSFSVTASNVSPGGGKVHYASRYANWS